MNKMKEDKDIKYFILIVLTLIIIILIEELLLVLIGREFRTIISIHLVVLGLVIGGFFYFANKIYDKRIREKMNNEYLEVKDE